MFDSRTLVLLLSSLSLGLAAPATEPSELSQLETRSTEGIHLYGCAKVSGPSSHAVTYYVGYCANDGDCGSPSYTIPLSNACYLKYSDYASNLNNYQWEGAEVAMVPHHCTFPTGVTFSWSISSDAQSKADYTAVGTGSNGSSFTAYKDNKSAGPSIKDSDGNVWKCYKQYYFLK